MDEKDFEILSVLSETRNITKASDQLYITQSALSKRLKAIEKELNVVLFSRSHQGVHFTPAGEEVLKYCSNAAHELSKLRKSLDSMSDKVCGTLNAGISVNFSMYELPDILTEYHRQYPLVKLHITTGQSQELYKKMADGVIDISVLRGEYTWDGFNYLLSQENICLIFNKEFLGKPLKDFLYIGHRTDPVQAGLINRWLYENDIDIRNRSFNVNDISTCVEMVKRGLGWALIPEIALKGYNGVVKPCFFSDGEPFVRRTRILCQRYAQELPQIKAFIDILKRIKGQNI